MNNNNEFAVKNENAVFNRKGKLSIYTVAAAVILLAVLIVVNLIVASLPSDITVLDTSPNNMYTLSETTENICADLILRSPSGIFAPGERKTIKSGISLTVILPFRTRFR